MVLKFLVLGNTEIRTDLINTLIDGKNVMYVDKVTNILQKQGQCSCATVKKDVYCRTTTTGSVFGSVQDGI